GGGSPRPTVGGWAGPRPTPRRSAAAGRGDHARGERVGGSDVGRHGSPPSSPRRAARATKLCRRSPADALSGRIRKWARSEVKSALGHVGATGVQRRTGSEERLLRRLEQRRRPGAELLEQRRLVGLGSLEVAQLDVA